MKRLFIILLALGLVSGALAITAQIDTTGNMIKVEQRSTQELEGGKSVTTIFLEWGNINEMSGVGFHAFDGFVDPEYGDITVTDVRMFDSGGAYRIGCDDKITNEGPDYVEWRASTLGATDGLTVRIVSSRDTAIHVKVGDWYGEFSLKAGKVVSDSLRATTSVWSPGTTSSTTVHGTTAEQPAIAIVDFEAVNCDEGIAKAVGEIMRTELIATGRFRVIERAQLARVMEEHAFQLSGLVDAGTVAELGKLVGADYVAVGSVSRLAGTYTVAVRYIDVETAEAALGRTETADGEGMLPDVCRRLAAALTGLP